MRVKRISYKIIVGNKIIIGALHGSCRVLISRHENKMALSGMEVTRIGLDASSSIEPFQRIRYRSKVEPFKDARDIDGYFAG